MDDTKYWYQSKTVWGGLVAILGACGSVFGWQIATEDTAGLVDALAATATAAGGLIAIIGRMSASKRLK